MINCLLAVPNNKTGNLDPDDLFVDVRLFELENPESIKLESQAGITVYAGEYNTPIGRINRGEISQVRGVEGEVVTTINGVEVRSLSFRFVPENDGTLNIGVSETERTRSYPGTLTVKAENRRTPELLIINHVPLEDYVAGVLPNEYSFDDQEGTKAMAVVIRTYALSQTNKFGFDYSHVDHVYSQVYRGLQGVTPLVRSAVEDTRGQILTYNGKPIEAVYFASSGGHTASNDAVWQVDPLPYLRAKPDPYERDAKTVWNSSLDQGELLRILSARYKLTIEGFLLGGRSTDGRIKSIRLLLENGTEKVVPSNEFRMLVNGHFGEDAIRSTNFTARKQGNRYYFEGHGRGHGVGLSQSGAHGMALDGFTYNQILSYYYTGVEIQNIENDTRPLVSSTDTVPEENPVPNANSERAESRDDRPVRIQSRSPVQPGRTETRSTRLRSVDKDTTRTPAVTNRRIGW